ncbi:MAG: ribosome biogenesis GTP-binding protein YihA/YsxC [Megasphaera cerevisiae]|jgi:GTP-binding protein|nr:ribosome biogenesis GTP-binding protein YihA/YsxC [Megasphaera cerevisiae]
MTRDLQIINPKYVASAVRKDQYPELSLPEIAFLGRSNVGKSSLINSLCNQRGLARVSGEPGKTQTINFFSAEIREKDHDEVMRTPLCLVDLPGYGFARAGGKKRQMWSSFISEYITSSPRLRMLCLLIDLRHPGLAIDGQAYDWLAASGVHLQIIGTKSDKLKSNEKKKNLAILDAMFPADSSACCLLCT